MMTGNIEIRAMKWPMVAGPHRLGIAYQRETVLGNEHAEEPQGRAGTSRSRPRARPLEADRAKLENHLVSGR